MTIIVLLIAISLSIAVLFLVIFYWNMKSGQYDDTYTPSVRMLFDNKSPAEGNTKPDNASDPVKESRDEKGNKDYHRIRGVRYPDRNGSSGPMLSDNV
jgi:cbb3-type cytochrome oxidase maturation protein